MARTYGYYCPVAHALEGKQMVEQAYFISLKDETGQISFAVGENIVAIIPRIFPNQFVSSFSIL